MQPERLFPWEKSLERERTGLEVDLTICGEYPEMEHLNWQDADGLETHKLHDDSANSCFYGLWLAERQGWLQLLEQP